MCRVVDNLGDIGFVYRLARALSELPAGPAVRLVVDDLASFAAICPGIDPESPLQTVGLWQLVRWDNPGEKAVSLFLAERPRMVLECYACSRPPWLESILFDEDDLLPRFIVNLEYLTAESWARDFHRLPSFTRSPLVRKSIFMPGFQEGTGGLLQDTPFCALVDSCTSGEGKLEVRRSALESLDCRETDGSAFWFLVFGYEQDFSHLVGDLAIFNAEKPLLALVAAGRSAAPFLDAWNKAGCPFPVLVLPLLPQEKWDAFLAASDFSVVRGEETFSRACLAGHPFLWQCYPFDKEVGGYLAKVYAFLERIRPFLPGQDFESYGRLTLAFNGISAPAPGDLLAVLRALAPSGHNTDSPFSAGFASWAKQVRNLGNLAANLLTFMRDLE